MNELYWITRFDAIRNFLFIMSLFGFMISFLLFVCAMAQRDTVNIFKEGGDSWNKYMKTYQTLMYHFKRSIIVTLVLIVINIFIPTKNDALLIYGVGGTIDYIKANDTAKQLPDKCIKALDEYLDNLKKDENQKDGKEEV